MLTPYRTILQCSSYRDFSILMSCSYRDGVFPFLCAMVPSSLKKGDFDVMVPYMLQACKPVALLIVTQEMTIVSTGNQGASRGISHPTSVGYSGQIQQIHCNPKKSRVENHLITTEGDDSQNLQFCLKIFVTTQPQSLINNLQLAH